MITLDDRTDESLTLVVRHTFEKRTIFECKSLRTISRHEGAKGIKFGVIRKLYLSATKHVRNFFHKTQVVRSYYQ